MPPLVAHVIIVGFHHNLGPVIEFSYPPLLSTQPQSPTISDTLDISHPDKWGILPSQWQYLPLLSLPDGVHGSVHDVVFFSLPGDIHCVSVFCQSDTDGVRCVSAGSDMDCTRGAVQKSVVLLCRRPLFGVLQARLVPAVLAYFKQKDFSRTTILSSLYHSLNTSLLRPSLTTADTLFHALSLRDILRLIGPNLLIIIKLVLLEKRMVLYSHPVSHASNAVVALASVFHGALDAISPTLQPWDRCHPGWGLPLRLFGHADRMSLQPYAPLPVLREWHGGGIVGTSQNLGLLLMTAATARRRKTPHKAPHETPHKQHMLTPLKQSSSAPANMVTPQQTSMKTSVGTSKSGITLCSSPPSGIPLVDALINISTGKISLSHSLEPLCRTTRSERRFMRDLHASTSSNGTFLGSDDYIRERLRDYLTRFLRSMSSISGILGGPAGGETWTREMISFDLTDAFEYNETFVREWLLTRNAAMWARACLRKCNGALPPPEPLNQVADGWVGVRQNVVNRVSGLWTGKVGEGIAGLWKKIEQEVGRIDTAIANSNPSSPIRAENKLDRHVQKDLAELQLEQVIR